MELKEMILETVRAHADTARAAYKSRDNEVALLKANLAVVQHQLATVKLENIQLRQQLRKLGQQPSAVGAVAGDSR